MIRITEHGFTRALAIALVLLFLVPIPVASQQQDAGPKPFTSEELEQIVAPIALYPDGLLAQVFMASTYPVEIVQAARFQKTNANLKDPQLSEELQKYDWDDSVKFMVGVPQVLTMMDEKLDWLQKLGDAFLDQRKETMDAVQRLRAKAQAEGTLKTTPEQTVRVEPAQQPAAPPPAATQQPAAPAPAPTQQTIVIEQANPQTVYVPTYNPTTVYGAWPYPAYPPYAYYPPGYMLGTAAISFGIGMAVGGAIWGGCNWGGGDVDIDVNKSNNFNKNVNRGDRQRPSQGGGQGGRQNFQHNPEHRKGAQYRDKGTQQRYGKEGPAGASGRQDFRGRDGGGAQARDTSRGGGGRDGAGPSTADRSRGGGDVGGGRGGGGGNSAFQGMDRGGDARASSARGQSSFGGSSSARGGDFGGGGGGRSSSFSGGGGSRASTGGGGARSGGGGGGRSGGGGGGRGGGGGGRR